MTFPQWLDPTPITRQFVDGFADCPVRLVSQAHEFREARIEFDEEMRILRETRKAEALQRQHAGLKKAADKRLLAVLEDCLPGESLIQREKRKKREDYAKKRDYYAAKYQAKKAARLASLSNALRGGGSGEESSSPASRGPQ